MGEACAGKGPETCRRGPATCMGRSAIAAQSEEREPARARDGRASPQAVGLRTGGRVRVRASIAEKARETDSGRAGTRGTTRSAPLPQHLPAGSVLGDGDGQRPPYRVTRCPSAGKALPPQMVVRFVCDVEQSSDQSKRVHRSRTGVQTCRLACQSVGALSISGGGSAEFEGRTARHTDWANWTPFRWVLQPLRSNTTTCKDNQLHGLSFSFHRPLSLR